MKNRVWAFAIPAAILLAVFLVPLLLTGQSKVMDKPSKEDVALKMQSIQIPFIANNGQVDERVKFYAKTFGGTVFVTKDSEIVYSLPKDSSESGIRRSECRGELRSPNGCAIQKTCLLHHESNIAYCTNCLLAGLAKHTGQDAQGVAIKETLAGGRVREITGNGRAVTKVSYFKGNDPSQWKANIPTYEVVSLGEVYDGIELKLKAYGNNVEKLFCVKPGANPDQIQVNLSGAKGLWVNDEGQLVAETGLGPVKFTKPIAYQEIDGKRVEVAVEYQIERCKAQNEAYVITHPLPLSGGEYKSPLQGGDSGVGKSAIQNLSPTQTRPTLREGIGEPKLGYGFKVASYDKSKPLIIDPLLASTYLGGSNGDYGHSLAIDAGGNVYVTGKTESTDFPTTGGAYDAYNGGYDVFVSRLDGNLSACVATELDAEPERLWLKRETSEVETVTVTCENGDPVAGVTVTAKVKTGKERISVSPSEAVTDADGQATFTITATKKTGNAKVVFEADGLKDTVTVKVKKK